MKVNDLLITGTVPDDSFAIEIADCLDQEFEITDLVSLKTLPNTEFSPRFNTRLFSERPEQNGSLKGKYIIIVSSHNGKLTRNELAMRNLIMARAAKDNGAEKVILVEPDLFFSTHIRRLEKGSFVTKTEGMISDDLVIIGEAFTDKLYASLLKSSGVDSVFTVHNTSLLSLEAFNDVFGEQNFHNLMPDGLYHDYLSNSGIIDPYNAILTAPDEGASDFVMNTSEYEEPFLPFITFDKKRKQEHSIKMLYSEKSQFSLQQIRGKDVVVLDNLIRNGNTMIECCNKLKKYSPRKIVSVITHFYTSDHLKQKLFDSVIDEIITTDTIPQLKNVDYLGSLRKKMALLKIGKWVASEIMKYLHIETTILKPYYKEEISNKNQRLEIVLQPEEV